MRLSIATALSSLFFFACSSSPTVFTTEDPDGGSAPVIEGGAPPPPPPPGCDITKLPSESACVIDESAGIFVSASLGSTSGDGTRAKPFATIQAGIDFAKATKRRVYVCAESYSEQITVADGISIFGNLSCAGTWTVSTKRALVKAPASPAFKAQSIASPTRIEGVEIVAPDTMAPSASSIAFVAIGSPGLHFVGDRLHGGNAGGGAKGDDGVQLADSGNAKNGKSFVGGYQCCANFADLNCSLSCKTSPASAGGTNTCTGKGNFAPGPGGAGGAPEGRHWQNSQWQIIQGVGHGLPVMGNAQTAQGGAYNGASAGVGTPGANGTDGVTGAEFGSIDGNGSYVPSDGTDGKDGETGQGGGGGAGNVVGNFNIQDTYDDYVWGWSGGGGGAGGCPGLMATAGKGGGASIALVAIDSPIAIERSQLESAQGGAGGSAGGPSTPTLGGSGGLGNNNNYGGSGGDGGRAGISGNGGGGPSFVIASKGMAPTADTMSTLTPGAGGVGVSARNVGIYSIPASPSGKAAVTYAF